LTAVTVLVLSLIAQSHGHFVLQQPVSLGFDDGQEGTSPCGSFSINDRTTVTSFPIGGYPFHLLSTHTKSIFKYRAALASDTTSFVDLLTVSQVGVGDFCIPAVPGYGPWVGKDVVIQVVQFSVDGVLYQCAAATFVEGAAFAADSSCKNSTNVNAVVTAATNVLPSGTPITSFGPATGTSMTMAGNATTALSKSGTGSVTMTSKGT
ncbi:hypothetical protein BGZ60DRAFT_349237, partial [Tricladium varicosporioides]